MKEKDYSEILRKFKSECIGDWIKFTGNIEDYPNYKNLRYGDIGEIVKMEFNKVSPGAMVTVKFEFDTGDEELILYSQDLN